MRRFLTGLLCGCGVWIYFLSYSLETRGAAAGASASSTGLLKETRTMTKTRRIASLRGASPLPALISTAHGNGSSTFLREVWNITSDNSLVDDKMTRLVGADGGCDALLCGMSGVGKSTLLHHAKLGTVEHSCFPVPSEWRAFAEEVRLHGPFADKTFRVRHIDTCNLPCSGCRITRIKMSADLAVLARHWKDRVMAQYKGGLGYALRKAMWNCYGHWGSQDVHDYDLTVNVGADGRYCVRTGGAAAP